MGFPPRFPLQFIVGDGFMQQHVWKKKKSHELYKTLMDIANCVKAVCSINKGETVPLLIALVFQEEIDLLAVRIILFL